MNDTQHKPKTEARVEELQNKLNAFEYLKISEVQDDISLDIQTNELGIKISRTEQVDIDTLAYVIDPKATVEFYSTPEEVVNSER